MSLNKHLLTRVEKAGDRAQGSLGRPSLLRILPENLLVWVLGKLDNFSRAVSHHLKGV